MAGTRYSPGDILLANYPFTDHSTTKLRPILVVSEQAFNEGEDFVAVPISSQVRAGDSFGVIIDEDESYFPETGLRMTSTVKWTKPMTLTEQVVQRHLGTAPDEILREVRANMSKMLGSV